MHHYKKIISIALALGLVIPIQPHSADRYLSPLGFTELTESSIGLIDKRNLKYIFEHNDYLFYLTFGMDPFYYVRGELLKQSESNSTLEKYEEAFSKIKISERWYKDYHPLEQAGILKKYNAEELIKHYNQYASFLEGVVVALKEMLKKHELQDKTIQATLKRGLKRADAFLTCFKMLTCEKKMNVSLKKTLDGVLKFLFSYFSEVGDFNQKYKIENDDSAPNNYCAQDEIAYLFLALLFPLRYDEKCKINVSISRNKGYFEINIENNKTIDLSGKSVSGSIKRSGVTFELAQNIAAKLGGTIERRENKNNELIGYRLRLPIIQQGRSKLKTYSRTNSRQNQTSS